METFDPNKDLENLWAIYSGDFQVFTRRGPAINSLHRENCGILYELVDGKWVERARKNWQYPKTCENCGGAVVNGAWDFFRKSGKILTPLVYKYMCLPCRHIKAAR